AGALWQVDCRECGYSGPANESSEDKAIAAHNAIAAELQAAREMREELREFAELSAMVLRNAMHDSAECDNPFACTVCSAVALQNAIVSRWISKHANNEGTDR